MKASRKALSILTITLAAAFAFCILPALLSCGEGAPSRPELSLIYYDGHIHTPRSDGTGSVADIKATALARGLSAVIITDHCEWLTQEEWDSLVAETAAVSDESFLALPGFENTGFEGLAMRDHFLAYNVPNPFIDGRCLQAVWTSLPNTAGTGPLNPEYLTKWVDHIHSQGGIAVHVHTLGSTRLEYGVNNIEIYNHGSVEDFARWAKALSDSPEQAQQLAVTINNFAIYGERDLSTPVKFQGQEMPLRLALHDATKMLLGAELWLGSPEAPLTSWDELLMAYVDGTIDTPIFAVANSDAHNTKWTEDPLESNVGLAKTGLYVKELTPDEIYAAIKGGRSFATTGPSLAFDVEGELMGGTAPVSSGGSANLKLSVKAEAEGFILAEIRVIKNGLAWKTIEPQEAEYETTLVDDSVTEDGYYRVEVTSSDDAGNYQFAWSNPVFVDVP